MIFQNFPMFLIDILNPHKNQTYDFQNLERGIDYFVDFIQTGKSAIVTTAMALKQGDRVILPYRNKAIAYRVEDLKNYWNDCCIQTIRLVRI